MRGPRGDTKPGKKGDSANITALNPKRTHLWYLREMDGSLRVLGLYPDEKNYLYDASDKRKIQSHMHRNSSVHILLCLLCQKLSNQIDGGNVLGLK